MVRRTSLESTKKQVKRPRPPGLQTMGPRLFGQLKEVLRVMQTAAVDFTRPGHGQCMASPR